MDEPVHRRAAPGYRRGQRSEVVAGTSAGIGAGIVVVLVSLPLHSPDDALFNTAAIAVVSIIVSVGLALVWAKVSRRRSRTLTFACICTAGLLLAALAAQIVETYQQLERTVSFIVPLAALQFGLTTLLAPVFSRARSVSPWLLAALLATILGLGFGLVTQGDQQSGRLELPARPN